MAAKLSNDARAYVLNLISQGISLGNDKLPTEREIAARHGASYGTVRLVTQQLEAEGFIRKVRGSGTYIQPEAAVLLSQSSWRKLWYFHSPVSAQKTPVDSDVNYGCYVMDEIRKIAAVRNWNLQEVVVRSHDCFLNELRRNFSAGDAILYLPPTEPFTTRQLGELARYDSVPLVVIDTEFGDVSISHVTTDNRFGGMLAARQLLELGCRKLTVILSEPNLRQQRSRLQGFSELAQLAGASVEVIDCFVSVNDDRIEKVKQTMLPRLKAGDVPEAVFITSDAGAFGLLQVMKECNLTPGKDIALIGFDGVPYGRKMTPALASVVQPVHDICGKVFDILGNWAPGTHPQYQLYPVLRSGGSCAVPEHIAQNRPQTVQSFRNMIYRSPEK